MPSRDDFLQRVAPQISPSERERVCCNEELPKLVEVQRQVLDQIRALLQRFGFDRET